MTELATKQTWFVQEFPDSEDWEFAESNEFEELCDDFLHDLLEDYRIILQNEYEYLTSEEAIIEMIKANEYEFTEDGELY